MLKINKREKFWIQNLLWLTGLVFVFALISLFNIHTFNNSYMEEERQELFVFEKQIEWALRPYLEKKDLKMITKYCEDFSQTSVNLRVFDGNKNLIASSDNSLSNVHLRDDLNIPVKTDKIWKPLTKNKEIGLTKHLDINGLNYYLELSISEEDVLKAITEAQTHLFVVVLLFFIFLISGFIFILTKIRLSFNGLENSIKKIADGELDTVIEVPSLAILEELAISVKKMTFKLKNQIKQLEQLEKYKSDFVSNISHEIKTPITAINSAIELLESQNSITSVQDKECFEIIRYQVKSINKLVNDILSLSEIEIEKTKEKKHFVKFNLNELIAKAINYMAFDTDKINFIESENIDMFGDESLISTAITNLLTNAVRYSKSDKIDIKINSYASKIEICVKDYGVGIAKEHQKFLFDRFYRIDKARSRERGGTGLGLSIVKNIAELHNGYVKVESEPGMGSAFSIIINQN